MYSRPEPENFHLKYTLRYVSSCSLYSNSAQAASQKSHAGEREVQTGPGNRCRWQVCQSFGDDIKLRAKSCGRKRSAWILGFLSPVSSAWSFPSRMSDIPRAGTGKDRTSPERPFYGTGRQDIIYILPLHANDAPLIQTLKRENHNNMTAISTLYIYNNYTL